MVKFEQMEGRELYSAVPVAVDDVVTVKSGSSIVLDYLTLNDKDADGDVLRISSVTAPTNGTLVDNGDGSYTYTPGAGFMGDDTFSYTTTDDVDGSDSAVVKISVNATFNAEAARTQILSGVTQLIDPAQPGFMVAYGPTAYSISNYQDSNISSPMIAAATMGQGRVIAMGDHQFMNMNDYGGNASMRNLYINSPFLDFWYYE